MKKILSLVLAVMMMLSTFAIANAEISEEVLDMEHGTAMVWLDDTMYTYTIYELYEDDGMIFAFFSEDNGTTELAMALDNDLHAAYYEAVTADDIFAMIVYEADGTAHYSSCEDYAAVEGYGCDLAMTVYNENGWYQGLMIGYTACDETGESFELMGAFDIAFNAASVSNGAGSYETHNDVCSICDGSGMCGHCTLGYCSYCDYGQKECFCGFGDCSACGGLGYYSYYDYEYGIEYRDCSVCGGLGLHDYCNGTGFIDCGVCYGTGACTICYGSGECSYCYGTGR